MKQRLILLLCGVMGVAGLTPATAEASTAVVVRDARLCHHHHHHHHHHRRWVPGHYRWQHGKKYWVPGHYVYW